MHYEWSKFKQWLETHHPDGLTHLNPPSNFNSLCELQGELGVTLPVEYLDLLLLSNGQQDVVDGVYVHGLFGGNFFMDTNTMLEHLCDMRAAYLGGACRQQNIVADQGVQAVDWIPRWIPIIQNGHGDYLCLDMAPAQGGREGQVIRYRMHRKQRELVAPNLYVWLRSYVERLEANVLLFDNGFRGINEQAFDLFV